MQHESVSPQVEKIFLIHIELIIEIVHVPPLLPITHWSPPIKDRQHQLPCFHSP